MNDNSGQSPNNPVKNISQATSNPIIKDMEVHHHGHVHESKKWKEYFFQFFMLLLAVFLGSFAETKREEWVDGHKEHTYMESMVQDLKKDTAEISRCYSFNFEQIQKLDTLQTLLSRNGKLTQEEIYQCYGLSWYLLWYSTAVFDERTMSQLVSSGNMRLIREKGAADSIMDYYNSVKRIDQQKQQYVAYINGVLGTMYKVFDISYLSRNLSNADTSLHLVNNDWHDLHFRTADPAAFSDLGSSLENVKIVIYNYMVQLGLIRQQGDKLVRFLKNEYKIKE